MKFKKNVVSDAHCFMKTMSVKLLKSRVGWWADSSDIHALLSVIIRYGPIVQL